MFYKINDLIHIFKKRIAKIIKWSISSDQIEIYDFLSTINIIRRWVKNFIKIVKSLFRFIEKVFWR